MVRGQSGAQRKHVPHRTCVVCRQTSDKRTLTRIVRTPEDGVVVDVTGKRNGRGAYVCDQDACWEQALMTAVLDRALRTTLTEADRVRLREQRPHVG
jgi:predicted RNA-binding protein YlxR (DUF448 family)